MLVEVQKHYHRLVNEFKFISDETRTKLLDFESIFFDNEKIYHYKIDKPSIDSITRLEFGKHYIDKIMNQQNMYSPSSSWQRWYVYRFENGIKHILMFYAFILLQRISEKDSEITGNFLDEIKCFVDDYSQLTEKDL
jgi:hypothetical protein